MNLHVSHDNIFIDYIISATESLHQTEDNRFCIYLTGNDTKPKLVKSNHVEYSNVSNDSFFKLLGNLEKYERVFIHWMHGFSDEVALSLPTNKKLIWCFWGGDGLESESLLKWVYQKKSYQLFRKLERKKVQFNYKFFREYYYHYKMAQLKIANHKQAMQKVNYMAHYLKSDYEIVKKVSNSAMVFIPFFYAPYEKIVKMDADFNQGENILLGNSDTITNNHLEAIDLLSQVKLGSRKVICPLSYEKGEYAKIIHEYGTNKLATKFKSLIDFMPLAEYNTILASVGYAIMNHNRSQALGNIYTLLYNGVKIFMSKDSTLYIYLKDCGFKIFCFQSDFDAANLIPLGLEAKLQNRVLLKEYFGVEKHLENMKDLLSI
jgi:dTDP-N-acetylfucosamine:lipid II N-acetylfucosaminyltransferase